ncbi:MAG: 30S ribosomal protein S6e [Candidatus Micrarchaeota archaeon]
MRVVISEKSGKSYQFELPKEKEVNIIGKKIGEELDGNLVGAAGYVLKLTGGSDGSGFPMKQEIAGSAKKLTLTTNGVGFKAERNGERRRKYARGNTYSAEIVQVNTQVKSEGPTTLDQLFPKIDKEKK